MAKPQYQGAWTKVRLYVLERDGWQCQIQGPGCTTTATEVDHIHPGSGNNPTGLRAACKHCNVVRANQGRRKQPHRRRW